MDSSACQMDYGDLHDIDLIINIDIIGVFDLHFYRFGKRRRFSMAWRGAFFMVMIQEKFT